MSTILDVAEHAGVGVGTVSRVLNSSPGVSDRTRAKVQMAIEELGYRPSSVARALKTGRTNSVYVFLPFLTRPSMFERLRGVVDGLSAKGYELVLRNVESERELRDDFEKLPRPSGVILVTLALSDEQLRELRVDEVPVVTIDVPLAQVPSVLIDDVEGGRIATRHLVELGHERVAFVGDADTGDFRSLSGRNRIQGYREVIEANGIEARPDYVKLRRHSRAEAAFAVGELLDLSDPPTAVFANSDNQALGVVEGARNRGVKVPDGLSVVGFDDIDAAKYADLTTVRQPLYESGREAVRILFGDLDGDEPLVIPRQLSLELIVRGSTSRAD